MIQPNWHVSLTLGALLVAALGGGRLVGYLGVPKVTAYLLAGLVLGPNLSGVVPKEHIEQLDPLAKLAIALVMFSIGCHLPLAQVRLLARPLLRLSAGELALTFFVVTAGLLVLQKSLGQSHWWQTSLLFGTLALATAPATTVLVLSEMQSEGPLTEFAKAAVAVNNLVCIVAFECLFIVIHLIEGKLAGTAYTELWLLARDLAGSVLLGVIGGLLVAYVCGRAPARAWAAPVIAVIALLLGVALTAPTPYLLVFLAMGMTVANASDQAREVDAMLGRLTGLLSIVFFSIHGAYMDLGALWAAGSIGLAYIALRSAGKYFGVFLAARKGNVEPSVRQWLGAALLPQAGAAISLAALAAGRDEAIGTHLQTIILGTVVFFEIVGPILVRHGVIHAGEAPLAQAVRHTTTTPFEELRLVCERLLAAAGYESRRKRSPDQLTVGELTRRNVRAIPARSTFDEVIEHIGRSHDNTFPVVSGDGELAGLIRYRDLRDALFDPRLGGLVRAEDLASPPDEPLFADDHITHAWQRFSRTHDDLIPVVNRDGAPQLLGVLRRRDIVRLFVKRSEQTEA